MPIATPEIYAQMLDTAKQRGFAFPAINVTSSQTLNAALRGFADAGSDGIIQISTGGAEYLSGAVKEMVTGAVALAEFAYVVAAKYPIHVALHTDHCPKDKLDGYMRPLVALSKERVARGEQPLFQSHMWDGSAVPLKENLEIAAELLAECAAAHIVMEMEIGVVGGEEDGIVGEINEKLYTTPEDALATAEAVGLGERGRYLLAATFGNVHGVYKPGHVKLRPLVLKEIQEAVGHERYTLPEMGRVWSEARGCRGCVHKVEVLVLEAHARAGTVPADSVQPVRSAPPPTPEAVAAVEAVTDHDVIAFLTAWADNTTPRSAAAYVHYGMTSSDLLDTALAIQLTEATDLLVAKATRLVAVLRDHALEHAGTLRPGRTHGIHAEPDSWGHRVADFAFAMARCRDRIVRRRGGGRHAVRSGRQLLQHRPRHRGRGIPALGLRAAPVATQVVMRDGIAEWVSALALAATVCEAVALEVRHGQRTEVRELAEPFRPGQKGSSAMPHKKNRSAPSGSRAWPGWSAAT